VKVVIFVPLFTLVTIVVLFFFGLFGCGFIAACHTVVAPYVVLEKILMAKLYVLYQHFEFLLLSL